MKEVEKLTVAVQTLSGENPSIRARVASAGERITPEILKHYLDYLQIAKFSVINATDVIAVRGSFDDADPDPTTSKPQIEEKLLPLILNKQGVFVGGFHGKDPKEEQLPHRFTKTFSRGGSDTTATFLMHILSLLPELYVDSTQLLKAGAGGLMTADPKIVDGAQVIDNLPYEIAKTASYMGAKVLHAKATAWAEKAKKPIDCLSLQEGTGTRINGESTNSQTVLTLLKILSISLAGIMDKPGIARDVSNAIASLGIDINIIAQPNDGLFRLTVPYSEDDDSIQNLSAMQEKYREINFLVDSGYAIGLVGLDANSPSLQMKMLEGLNDTQVGNEYSLISGKNCTTILLSRDEENAKQAIRNIHKRIYDSVS
jgi:aspartate kinase